MKEAVTTREVNQFLAGERTRLQSEKNHVGKELEQERQNSDKRKREVEDVIRKVIKVCFNTCIKLFLVLLFFLKAVDS